MRMSAGDLERVRRRRRQVVPRFWSLAIALPLSVLLMGLALSQRLDNPGKPLSPTALVLVGLYAVVCLAAFVRYLPNLLRRYVGLSRDLRARTKQTVLASLRDKTRGSIWNGTERDSYYLVFDFGRVQVGQSLWLKARRGQLLTLVLSAHGHELLAVSEAGIETVPWQL